MDTKTLISHNTARWIAPVSFILNFLAQTYGMTSDPNMKDVNDANVSFFSPQPFFIAGFFFPQQLFQLAWLYQLWKAQPTRSETERRTTEIMTQYAPFYVIGNICIGLWMPFWVASYLAFANIFVVINTSTQLFYMIRLLPTPMNVRGPLSFVLTHIVSKTFAGIGVLDILHNTSVAFFVGYEANFIIGILTLLGFSAACFFSDWIFGACLVYDLIGLAVGQEGTWSTSLYIIAGICAVIVAGKNYLRPPYTNKDPSYVLTGNDESDSLP